VAAAAVVVVIGGGNLERGWSPRREGLLVCADGIMS